MMLDLMGEPESVTRERQALKNTAKTLKEA